MRKKIVSQLIRGIRLMNKIKKRNTIQRYQLGRLGSGCKYISRSLQSFLWSFTYLSFLDEFSTMVRVRLKPSLERERDKIKIRWDSAKERETKTLVLNKQSISKDMTAFNIIDLLLTRQTSLSPTKRMYF